MIQISSGGNRLSFAYMCYYESYDVESPLMYNCPDLNFWYIKTQNTKSHLAEGNKGILAKLLWRGRKTGDQSYVCHHYCHDFNENDNDQ